MKVMITRLSWVMTNACEIISIPAGSRRPSFGLRRSLNADRAGTQLAAI